MHGLMTRGSYLRDIPVVNFFVLYLLDYVIRYLKIGNALVPNAHSGYLINYY